jgi:hypothetical protein
MAEIDYCKLNVAIITAPLANHKVVIIEEPCVICINNDLSKEERAKLIPFALNEIMLGEEGYAK